MGENKMQEINKIMNYLNRIYLDAGIFLDASGRLDVNPDFFVEGVYGV